MGLLWSTISVEQYEGRLDWVFGLSRFMGAGGTGQIVTDASTVLSFAAMVWDFFTGRTASITLSSTVCRNIVLDRYGAAHLGHSLI